MHSITHPLTHLIRQVFWADEILEGYMSWYTGHGWTWPNTGGPAAGIGFWWAFWGTNFVWVIVP
jgi:hypothetical protein